jgi:ParB family chromosome partitioning protein
MKLDAMKRQGQRVDLTSVPVAQKLAGKTSRQILSESVGESQDQIRRFICLTNLIPELMAMVDDSRIAFRPAVEISYLPEKKQRALLDTMQIEACTPSLAQAQKMKRFEGDGKLTGEVILSIMGEEKPNQVEQFKMPIGRVAKFFPKSYTKQQMEETILNLLETWHKKQRERQGMER